MRRINVPAVWDKARPVLELGVDETRVLGECVVNGMADTASSRTAEAHVQGGHVQVVQEDRVVRSRTEGTYGKVTLFADRLCLFLGPGLLQAVLTSRFPNALPGLGIVDVPCHIVDYLLQRMTT